MGLAILMVIILLAIIAIEGRTIMSATQTGLAALQAFVTQFSAFVTQVQTDVASLTTAIQNAITALQNSGSTEDPAVAAAVTALQTSLGTLEAQDTAIEGLTTSLNAADPSSGTGTVAPTSTSSGSPVAAAAKPFKA